MIYSLSQHKWFTLLFVSALSLCFQQNCSAQSIPLTENVYDDSKFIEFIVVYGKEADQVASFVMEIIPEWAPIGVKHLEQLINDKFYDNCKFFRVLPNFIAQFGLNADPKVQKKYGHMLIPDEIAPAGSIASNVKGSVTFAMRGKNTRSTHLFINYNKNKNLDKEGFSPIGRIVYGMDIVNELNSEHKEKPDQGKITNKGNDYLDANFPNLSYIVTARFIDWGEHLHSSPKTSPSSLGSKDMPWENYHGKQTLVACQLQNIHRQSQSVAPPPQQQQPLIIEIHEEWAPLGARRFLDLVSLGYYDQVPIYRAVEDFIVQFGLHRKEKEDTYRQLLLQNGVPLGKDGSDLFFSPINDDENKHIPFVKGMLSFAGSGDYKTRKNGQVFIPLSKLPYLGKAKWERPFGYIQPSSMAMLKEIFKGYGELTNDDDYSNKDIGGGGGGGPNIHRLSDFSDISPSEYLKTKFPKLTYIEKCEIVSISPNSTFRNLIIHKDVIKQNPLPDSSSSSVASFAGIAERPMKPEALAGLMFIFIATFSIVYHMLQYLGDGDINIDSSFGEDIAFKDL